jgi:ATP synthase subunit 6
MFSPLEQFDLMILAPWGVYEPDMYDLFPFYTDYTVLHMMIIWYLIRSYWYFFNSRMDEDFEEADLIPHMPQRFFEAKLIFIYDLIKQQLGGEYYYFFPQIFFSFFVILFFNLLSLVPFGFALTSHIELMLFISLTLTLGFFFMGLYRKGWGFFWVFLPSCPIFMVPFLILIEIFSYIIRCFSLAIRLSANITAGHTLVYIISSFLLKVIFTNYAFFLIGLCFLSAIWILEIGVAFLQAYVFTILLLIYLNDSLKSGHH